VIKVQTSTKVTIVPPNQTMPSYTYEKDEDGTWWNIGVAARIDITRSLHSHWAVHALHAMLEDIVQSKGAT